MWSKGEGLLWCCIERKPYTRPSGFGAHLFHLHRDSNVYVHTHEDCEGSAVSYWRDDGHCVVDIAEAVLLDVLALADHILLRASRQPCAPALRFCVPTHDALSYLMTALSYLDGFPLALVLRTPPRSCYILASSSAS